MALIISLISFVVLPSTPISQFPAYPRSSTAAASIPQPSPTTPTPSQPTAAAPVKLQLNKQQLAVAHKMFEEAPTLTREQKALILGFMAGSRGIDIMTGSVKTLHVCVQILSDILI